MRRDLSILLSLILLIGGCGDGGGATLGTLNASTGCGPQAPSRPVFKSSLISKTLFNRYLQFAQEHWPVRGAHAQGVSATVSGNITYENREFSTEGFTGDTTWEPIRFMQVQVVRESDGAVLASGATDLNGDYSMSFTNSGANGVYVRVLSKTEPSLNVHLEVRNNLTQNRLYAVRSYFFNETAVPSPVDFGATVASGSGGAFNILDVLTDASELVSDLQMGTAPPLLKAYWEVGSTDGTCFNSALDAIFLLGKATDTDEYDDDVIVHEYGHFLAEKLSRDDSPGGPHTINDSSQDARLAWSEGWGYFFSSVINKKSFQVDTLGGDPPNHDAFFFDIEGPSFSGEALYSTNELAVAAVLWDIFDDPTDPSITGTQPEPSFDTLILGMSPIWDVFTQALPTASQAKLGAFWEGWIALGKPTVGMDFIFFNRQIEFFEDSFESTDTLPTARKISVGDFEARTLYLSNFRNDEDIVAFDATVNEFYTVETLNLINGADTAIEIFCCDSTYMLVGFSDNRDGQQYPFNCGLNCPPNGFLTLSSQRAFVAVQNGTHYVRVTRSVSAPASAGRFGSYVLRITSP